MGRRRARGAGRITYPDGAVYEGQMQADLRHGTGTLTRPDGMRYEGDWQDGALHGRAF